MDSQSNKSKMRCYDNCSSSANINIGYSPNILNQKGRISSQTKGFFLLQKYPAYYYHFYSSCYESRALRYILSLMKKKEQKLSNR